MERLVDRGRGFLDSKTATDSDVQIWLQDVRRLIRDVYGSFSSYGLQFATAVNNGKPQALKLHTGILSRIQVGYLEGGLTFLEALIRALQDEVGATVQSTPQTLHDPIWQDIHPSIVESSKSLFDEGFCGDAVDAAFKQVNITVKRIVKAKTSKELDGSGLMTTAFSPNQPVIALADQSTESGKNIQQGFMRIFEGAMIGIRNPGAHDNIEIKADRARHLIYLASLLSHMIEERVE
ncbi:MAG TPA: TIGR02391 family protein [Opitutaceae bacterium]|nr:TIGR02391 family protein [Opitutaceae bacterium]